MAQRAGTSRKASARPALWIAVALAALTWAAFEPARSFGFLPWDDPHYVVNNPHVTGGLTLENVRWAFTAGSPYWHPLTWISLMTDVQLFGLSPSVFHTTNLLMHVLSVVLLFVFLHWTTGAMGRSAFVAAIFAVHPARVESVAWIAERKDVLPALLLMITLVLYAWYVRRPSFVRYGAVTVSLALGLLAKPMLSTAPFALLLLDVWPLERLAVKPVRLLVEKLPWIGLALTTVVLNLTLTVQPLVTLEVVPFGLRVVNAIIYYVQYGWLLVWPANLSPFHPLPQSMAPWWIVGGALALLVAFTLMAIRVRRRAPYVIVGWLWFLGTLVPIIGLIQAGDQGIADRYAYLPSIGIFVMAVWGASDVLARRPVSPRLLAGAGVVIVLTCAVMSRSYVWHWRDGVTLWTRAVAVDPGGHRVHANLGNALAGQGRIDEAAAEFRTAIQLAPHFTDYRRYLGAMLAQHGRVAEAITEFTEVLRRNPGDALTHDELGLALTRSGRIDEAIFQHREALRLAPDTAASHANLAVALTRKGDTAAALEQCNRALALNPLQPQVYTARAALYLGLGRMDDAIRDFTDAQRLDPFSPERSVNLGAALARAGRRPEARDAFQKALDINPRYAEAHNALGTVLSDEGRPAEAIASFTKALELQPGLLHAYSNRGRAFALQGDTAAAIRDFEQILRLDPGNVSAQRALDALRGGRTSR